MSNDQQEDPNAMIARMEREMNNPQAVAGTGPTSDSGEFLEPLLPLLFHLHTHHTHASLSVPLLTHLPDLAYVSGWGWS